jgi:hypothetical protein
MRGRWSHAKASSPTDPVQSGTNANQFALSDQSTQGRLNGAVGADEVPAAQERPAGADNTRSFAALATEGTSLGAVFM